MLVWYSECLSTFYLLYLKCIYFLFFRYTRLSIFYKGTLQYSMLLFLLIYRIDYIVDWERGIVPGCSALKRSWCIDVRYYISSFQASIIWSLACYNVCVFGDFFNWPLQIYCAFVFTRLAASRLNLSADRWAQISFYSLVVALKYPIFQSLLYKFLFHHTDILFVFQVREFWVRFDVIRLYNLYLVVIFRKRCRILVHRIRLKTSKKWIKKKR